MYTSVISVAVVLTSILLGWIFQPAVMSHILKQRDRRDHSKIEFISAMSNNHGKADEGFIKRSQGSINLSIVIPAFNEEHRLPKMLEDTLSYLATWGQTKGITYEVNSKQDIVLYP